MSSPQLRLSPTALHVSRPEGGRVLLGDRLQVPVVLNRTAAVWMDLVLHEQVEAARRELLVRYNDTDPGVLSAALEELVGELTSAGILVLDGPPGPAGTAE